VAPKGELLRIVVIAGDRGDVRATIDHTGAMPGRGAYLCRERPSGGPARSCLDLADRRGAIARALRSPAKIDRELVESLSR
jgi:predicted RNA-binding protein YlxR (DUF448 family)